MPRLYKGKRSIAEKLGVFFVGLAVVIGVLTAGNAQNQLGLQPQTSDPYSYKAKKWDKIPEPELRATGLVPESLGETLNSEWGHLDAGENKAAYTLYQVADSAYANAPIDDADFLVTASAESFETLTANHDPVEVNYIGMTPAILVTTKEIAEILAKNDAGLTDRGQGNYTINLSTLNKLLAEDLSWKELDPKLQSTSRMEVTLPDLTQDPFLAMKYAQAVALSEGDRGVLDEETSAIAAAHSDPLELVGFATGKESSDLLKGLDRDNQPQPQINVVWENDLRSVRYAMSENALDYLAFIYPDQLTGAEYQYVALTQNGKSFADMIKADYDQFPFRTEMHGEVARIRGREISDDYATTLYGRPLPKYAGLAHMANPRAVAEFNKALPEIKQANPVPQKMERPEYAK